MAQLIEARFPEKYLDNTMRKDLVKCQMLAHWRHELGLQVPGGNEHLVAGAAFAKGMEVMRKQFYGAGLTQEQVLKDALDATYKQYGDFQPPKGSVKTAERTAGALIHYSMQRPLDQEEFRPIVGRDGRLMVEVSFKFPINVYHPVTDEQMEYCGRFDMLAHDGKGGAWVVDEKTTGRLGDAWVNQWAMDSQMTGYVWGAQKLLQEQGLNYEVKGAVINGVAILKNGYDLARCQVNRQAWEVKRWKLQMEEDFQNWTSAFFRGKHNMVMDHACALYNAPCPYVKLCRSQTPERLMDTYEVRRWNPVERDV